MKIYIIYVLTLLNLSVVASELTEPSHFFKGSSPHKVLIFLSKNCPCSRSHVQHLNTLNTAYKEVSFYGIVTDPINKSSQHEVYSYYQAKNFNFPIIKDPKQILVKKYKALKTPHAVILSKGLSEDYNIVYQGGVSNRRNFSNSNQKFLQENLRQITQGLPLKYKVGKSLGCYIRRF